MKQIAQDQTQQIKEERDEDEEKQAPSAEAQTRQDMDEDSDDIARATDQETVAKLAADKATVLQSAQYLNTTFDESINRPQDTTQGTMNKEVAQSIALSLIHI